MNLPEAFAHEMKDLLAEEYEAYLDSYQHERVYGLRINTRKITCEEFERIVPFKVKRIPWTTDGYFYDESSKPSRHPYYYAGLYYLQEPSAMIPGQQLFIEPGDKVLDLCAAPGGKATRLAAQLDGEGVLIANDISTSRARGLLKNLELFGISNSFVLSEDHKRLLEQFPNYFDKILIDAPCSGEGMFRKDPSMIKSWLEKGPAFYHEIQKDILFCAYQMLKPGGTLLYSTCTFSPLENEGVIDFLLRQTSDMEVIKGVFYDGFSHGIPEKIGADDSIQECFRIWPHKLSGEGHFVALLHKKKPLDVQNVSIEKGRVANKKSTEKKLRNTEEFAQFMKQIKREIPWERFDLREEKIYLLPKEEVSVKGLRILRTGLLVGEIKKERFVPSQAFAMALMCEDYTFSLQLNIEDERVLRYLKGESIPVEELQGKEKGWYLICVDQYPLGWGKYTGGLLKNKYCPGWRYQS